METNSEKKFTWVTVALGVLVVLGTALDQVLGWGVIPKEHAAYPIVTAIAGVIAQIVKYTAERGDKHEALAARALAEAKLLEAKAGAGLTEVPPSPPQS